MPTEVGGGLVTSVDAEGAETEPERPRRRSRLWIAATAALVFAGIAGVLYLVGGLSVAHLSYTKAHVRPPVLPDAPWFNAWFRWDGGWYDRIAERGYDLTDPSGLQSPAAYFPAYPALMRVVGEITHDRVLAGIFITFASGMAVAALFAVWLRDRMEPAARWTAVLLLLLYPFAYYLYGAVYADALFVAAVLACFLLIEHDRPWLAGLAGAVATAARPVGAAVLLPLVVLVVERRGGLKKLKWKDAGVLLAGAGVGAFCIFTWMRYGTPFAFIDAQSGWDQEPGVQTWFKTDFFRTFRMFDDTSYGVAAYLFHPIITFAALALVPRVKRRFGWGYASYVIVVVGVSAISTKNFFGMARYVLAAFPCFAVAGELLSRWPRARTATLAVCGALLVGATSLFARGFYLS